jgi:hypothetical protein
MSDVDLRETEYSGLLTEIGRRSTYQQAILALNLTASGAIFSFALTSTEGGS